MTALIGLRLGTYLRAHHAIAPAVAALVALGLLYGGGLTQPTEAYGVSAVVLFGILAWQAKILFDAEPDVQRRLMRISAGSPDREIAGGLVAAAGTSLPTIAVALLAPWLLHAVSPDAAVGAALLFGLWAHALAVPAAVAVGAWASRPVVGNAGRAVLMLVGSAVLSVVLGLAESPVPWLMPPLMATARLGADGSIAGAEVVRLTGWAIAWSAIPLGGYWMLRRRRP